MTEQTITSTKYPEHDKASNPGPSSDPAAGRECPRCDGTGELGDGPEIEGEGFIERCPDCNGTGLLDSDDEGGE